MGTQDLYERYRECECSSDVAALFIEVVEALKDRQQWVKALEESEALGWKRFRELEAECEAIRTDLRKVANVLNRNGDGKVSDADGMSEIHEII